MMRTTRPEIAVGLALGLALAAAGCIDLGPKPDPTNHYVLSSSVASDALQPASAPAGEEPAAASKAFDREVGVGPVRIPSYLDRNQIVRRRAPNRLDVSAHERWAEPLSTGFTRVLRQDLAACLPAAILVEHPWPARDRPALQVEVDVVRFEAAREGPAALEARWTLRRLDPEAAPVSGIAKLEEEVGGAGEEPAIEAEVAALSRLVGRLAAEIAVDIAAEAARFPPSS